MNLANVRILVIDDMNTMRKIICKTVRDMGVGVVSDAQDGDDAWAKIQAAEPAFDLILSDWNMPNCTGMELLKRVRADLKLKTTPFVLLTAEAEAHQVGEALNQGVSGYIVKPFTPEILKQKLMVILSKMKAAA
jgi:two-component system chemotaxis response regulator CheY